MQYRIAIFGRIFLTSSLVPTLSLCFSQSCKSHRYRTTIMVYYEKMIPFHCIFSCFIVCGMYNLLVFSLTLNCICIELKMNCIDHGSLRCLDRTLVEKREVWPKEITISSKKIKLLKFIVAVYWRTLDTDALGITLQAFFQRADLHCPLMCRCTARTFCEDRAFFPCDLEPCTIGAPHHIEAFSRPMGSL